jgi:hypothetical protein
VRISYYFPSCNWAERRAKNEGLWEFGCVLFVVLGFDGKKHGLEFVYMLTWIHVFNLSLGLMNDSTGKEIIDKV